MVTNFILLRPLWTGSESTKDPLGSLQTSLHLMVKPRTKYDHILYLLASFCMMVCRSVCSAGVCCGCGAEDAWSVENFGAKRLGAKWNLLVSILGAYSDNIYYPFSPSSCTAHLHTFSVNTTLTGNPHRISADAANTIVANTPPPGPAHSIPPEGRIMYHGH